MKITLIQPSKPRIGTIAEDSWELCRPLSLHYLASSIKNKTKHVFEIIDFESKSYVNKNYEEVIKNKSSNIWGLTCTTYTRFECIEIIKLIKKNHPNSLVVVGGVHFMYVSEEALKEIQEIDIVCRGEGDIIILNLLKALEIGTDLTNVKGITFRNKNGEIIRNQDEEVFEDLDTIIPFYDFDYEDYTEYLFGFNEKIRAVSILSSRGCPYNCVFCSKAGMKYRLRDPKLVIDEIEYYYKNFQISAFNFLDLTFTVNNEHVKNICNEIIKRNINIRWWCESRANIDLELLKIMKAAGCVSIVIGVETGSDRLLKTIVKGISKIEVVNFLKECKKYDIKTTAYFMFSLPGETKNDVKETIKFINELRAYTNSFSFQPSMIFPGTKLEKIALEKGILPNNFSWHKPYKNTLNSELGQLNNIPLYIEHIKPRDLKKLLNYKHLNDGISSIENYDNFRIFLKNKSPIQILLKYLSFSFKKRGFFELLFKKKY
ncbi:MAG: radical SAM protein [Spirochaetes bacterium]|nr:radical SAM protein [Spirochaetota bacterium]